MPWISKPSGTIEIERRATPYLTDAMKAQLEADVMGRYPTRRAAMLPVLHAIQHAYGWIPHQALEETAAFLEVAPAEVIDAATFYEEFFLQPKGRHLIQVCQSISCELCGHISVLDRIQQKLDIVPGETTDDGKFTLMMVECLGACDGAPAVLVDGKLYERMTWERFEAALDEL